MDRWRVRNSHSAWGNVRNGCIAYKRGKTGVEANLPILPGLQREIDLVSKSQFLFMTHSGGQAYKSTSLGNWFKDRTVESGLTVSGANLHGLRKAGATLLANHGATDLEIAAYLAHKDTKMTAKYVRTARRSTLGASGMAKLPRT